MDQAVPALGTVRIVIVMRHYPTFNSAEDFLDDLRFLRLYEHAIEAVAERQLGIQVFCGLAIVELKHDCISVRVTFKGGSYNYACLPPYIEWPAHRLFFPIAGSPGKAVSLRQV